MGKLWRQVEKLITLNRINLKCIVSSTLVKQLLIFGLPRVRGQGHWATRSAVHSLNLYRDTSRRVYQKWLKSTPRNGHTTTQVPIRRGHYLQFCYVALVIKELFSAILCHAVWYKLTEASEMLTASIFRAKAACISDTSVSTYKSTRLHNPEHTQPHLTY
jgi:hypothetical protein